MNIIAKLRQLLCRHDWMKVAIYEKIDKVHNVRYSERRYECRKCGKKSMQDGRHDRLASKSGN